VGVSEPFGALEGILSDAMIASTIEDMIATDLDYVRLELTSLRVVPGRGVVNFSDALPWTRSLSGSGGGQRKGVGEDN
jgi:hypothetical protein